MELRIDARNLDMQSAWQEKIVEEKEKLTRHHSGQVLSLRVSLESTSHHKEGGYQVGLVVKVPNETVVIKRKGDGIMPLIVESFDVLGLKLKEIQRKKRKSEKGQEPERPGSAEGIVKHVYPYESYGFIVTSAGREIYFHENALKDLVIDEMAEGDEVRFGEAEGDKGPCATWVRVLK